MGFSPPSAFAFRARSALKPRGTHAAIRHRDPAEAAGLLNRAYRRLTEHYGFHMVTLQLETACLDERHARDLDVTHPEGQRVSPAAADTHVAHADPLDSAAQDAKLTDNS